MSSHERRLNVTVGHLTNLRPAVTSYILFKKGCLHLLLFDFLLVLHRKPCICKLFSVSNAMLLVRTSGNTDINNNDTTWGAI